MNVIAAWCNRMKPVSDARGLVSMNRVGASCCVSRTLIHLIILLSAATGCALGQSAGTFTATGSITTARAGHTATLLADGRVLIAGGGDASAEIYDPSTGAFTVTGSMSTPRRGASSTLLPDGRVLIVGGNPPDTTSAELYDPLWAFSLNAGNLTDPRLDHTAILLSNGKVLILGGYTGDLQVALDEREDQRDRTPCHSRRNRGDNFRYSPNNNFETRSQR